MVLVVVDVDELVCVGGWLVGVVGEEFVGFRRGMLVDVGRLALGWEGEGFQAAREGFLLVASGYGVSGVQVVGLGQVLLGAGRVYERVMVGLSGGGRVSRVRVDTGLYAPEASGMVGGVQRLVGDAASELKTGLGVAGGCAGADRLTGVWAPALQDALTGLERFFRGVFGAAGVLGKCLVVCANTWARASFHAGGRPGLDADTFYPVVSFPAGVCTSLVGVGVRLPVYYQWAAGVLQDRWLATEYSSLKTLGAKLVSVADCLSQARSYACGAWVRIGQNHSAETPVLSQAADTLARLLTPVVEACQGLGEACGRYADRVDTGLVQIRSRLHMYRNQLEAIAAVTLTDDGVHIDPADPETAAQAQVRVQVILAELDRGLESIISDVADTARSLAQAANQLSDCLTSAAGGVDQVAGMVIPGPVDLGPVPQGWELAEEPRINNTPALITAGDKRTLQELLTTWSQNSNGAGLEGEQLPLLVALLMSMPEAAITQATQTAGLTGLQLSPLPVSPGVGRWWRNLAPSRQEELITSIPAVIANLPGIPYTTRSNAYTSILTTLATQAETSEQTTQTIQKILESLDAVRAKGATGMIVELDLSNLDEIKAAVAVGNLDTAGNVSWMIPGMNSTVKDSMVDWTRMAQNIYNTKTNALEKADRLGEGVAVVAWVGYQAPTGVDVVFSDKAQAGARSLAASIDGFRATHGTDPKVSVIGYSYGTGVAAYALKQVRDAVDSAILIGSPGLNPQDIPTVESLKVKKDPQAQANVWASKASNDLTADFGRFSAQTRMGPPHSPFEYPEGPMHVPNQDGRQNLNTADPADPSFGAKQFSSEGGKDPNTGKEYTGGGGHQVTNTDGRGYFDPASESANDIGMITTGQADKLTPLIPKPNFWDFINPPDGKPRPQP